MRSTAKTPSSEDPLAFLAGGGEMGALMRSIDWSHTALGPAQRWPQSLRTTVSTLLSSRFPILVWWGPELVKLYNDAYRQLVGDKHPRSMGQRGRECWPEIWHIIGPMLEGVMSRGEATWSENQLLLLERHGFAEECYFTFSYSPIRDESGSVGGVFSAVTETTRQVLGERRLSTLRDLAASGTEARSAEEACELAAQVLSENLADLPFALLYLVDSGEQVRLAGSAGSPPGKGGSPIFLDLSGDGHPRASPLSEAVRTGQPVRVDDLDRRFGSFPASEAAASPREALILPWVLPGEARVSGLMIAGLSPRLSLDEAYRSFLDLVVGNVGAAVANARALDEARKRAEALAELDRAKTQFFSNVSHEFRTPLTLMLGPVEEMLARSHTDLSPATKGQLEVVNRNGLRLLRLVNTLLDFSRIEAGRVRAVYQATDLAAFTAELASVFRAAIERAGLRLVVDCPALTEPVFVDRDMWEKIILNLLSNALKFTFEGEIAVMLRQKGPAVELRVRDTGMGIPQEEMPRLFERFHRIENARGRTHEGTGIGLALVQELVRLHGGVVSAESVLGQGTTFTVTLPLGSVHLPPEHLGDARSAASTVSGAAPYVEEALRWLPDEDEGNGLVSELPAFHEPVAVPYARPEPIDGDERPRVLVADDNADMRHYIARLLAEHYRVDAVPDGAAALALARERRPDLVLTDVMMPQLDGFGLLQALRDDPQTAGLPVIMLSARAGEESRVEGMEAGADDYLVKPFSARELLARVTAHLQMARMRREATESVERSATQRQLALDAARLGWWHYDPVQKVAWWDERYKQIFGITDDRNDIEVILTRLHPDDVFAVWQAVEAALDPDDPKPYSVEYRIRRPDGSVRWVEAHGVVAFEGPDRHRRATSLVGTVEDITERKLAEARLVESEARFRSFADTAPAMLWVSEPDGSCSFLSRGWCEFTGQTPGSGLGFGWVEAVHPGDQASARDTFLAANARHEPFALDYRLRRADGEYRWAVDAGRPRFGAAGEFLGYIGSVIDIHDRKRAEEQLRQAAKMEAIGRLAGGLAHDFNNQLQAVAGFARFVEREGGLSQVARADVREIQKGAERMASLTRQLLAFSRQQVLMPETLELAGAVTDARPLLERLIGPAISFRIEAPAAAVWVRVDRTQLVQVLLNLAINARDAMPEGGGLVVTVTRKRVSEDRLVEGGVVAAGDYGRLTVSDTGAGIAAEHLPHIFEPFYTTKDVGEGTGLGLATVHGIVAQSQGHVSVESAPGAGTRFTVLFPLADPPADAGAIPEAAGSERRRGVRILVVDDEPSVRMIMSRVLESEGYEVLLASDGKDALACLERERGAVDLVLSDVVMSGMGGAELGEVLAATYAEIPVAWMSGYPQEHGRVRRPHQPFLQKPVDMDRLTAMIRSTLRRRAAEGSSD